VQDLDPDRPTAVPVLECRAVTKSFPGVLALDRVDLVVRTGEIHALIGQNGAGKSTLVKTLTGVYRADEGALLVNGEPVSFRSADDAAEHGIAIVHQDSPLVAKFDVTRNAFLGRELASRFGRLDFRQMRRRTVEALNVVGASFGPDTLIQELSIGEREQVAIVAALVQEPSVLILDEPTASLGAEEVERLFKVIRNLQQNGVTIIYISHHLDEVFSLASTITVLRDGKRVGTFDVHEVKRSEIIHHMVGRELSQLYPKESIPVGSPILQVTGLQADAGVRSVDLTVRRGEIVGLAGLVGAGRTELALTIFGALPRTGGTVVLDGVPIKPRSPHDAMRAGIALIPEDRRGEGLITDLSVRANIALASQPRWANAGLVSLRSERAAAQGLVDRLRIATPTLEQKTQNLSGGNQQKVVIGRWLAADAKLYIFDEPTTGVDVGAKVEIYREMSRIARDGAGVVMISSDFDELVQMCDRIVVIKKGTVVKELATSECTVHDVLQWATGGIDDLDENAIPQPQEEHVTDRPTDVEPTDRAMPRSRAGTTLAQVASRARSRGGFARWGALIGMAIAVVLMSIGAPNLFSLDNIFLILKQGSLLSLIALSLTIVLISGGLDMSAGAISQFTANISSGFLIGGSTVAAAFGAGVGTGVLLGLLNTFFVVVVGLSPFVTTLGVMFIAIGSSFAYNHGQALTLHDQPTFFYFGQGHVGPIPVILILVIVLTAGLHFFLRRTRAGLRMYAVGQSPATAVLRGISRRRALVVAFMLHGILAGLAGVLIASYSYGASALATGLDFLISAFAAAFLGSVLSRTGELDVVGTVVAAMFIASLSNGLILNGASNLVLPGIQGTILIASILIGVVRRRDIGQMTIF
jgi:ABC-type sugar transport system ATPase subunit/ribose/xylose/arabinose/galactoside ABC-type transport system permease subunit